MKEIISFLVSPPYFWWLFALKMLFGLLTLAMTAATIYFFVKTQWFKMFFMMDFVEFFTHKPYGLKKLAKAWKKISSRLETGSEEEHKLAVIEAEDLLDSILKRIGFFGESLSEKLEKITSASLPNLEELKAAHEIRNSIVRNSDFRLTRDQARKTLEVYEKALTDLQAL